MTGLFASIPVLTFRGDSDGKKKKSACNAGLLGSVPGSGRAPREWNGNPLQYSCLENFMDRRAWQAAVYRVAKSQTQLKQLNLACIHIF